MLGAIAKLEHLLASLDQELERARHRLAEAERRLREAGIDPGVRGEKLDVDDFVRLARTT